MKSTRELADAVEHEYDTDESRHATRFVRAIITAARLDVVARLREMATRRMDTEDEAEYYEGRAWAIAADQLEAEVREAGR